MPHQCVRCNTFYEDGAQEIIKGCKCGGKLFFYVKKEKLEDMKKAMRKQKLSEEEKLQMESDIFDIVGSDIDRASPVVLDFESINVLKPGSYELDLVQMFKGNPLIFKLDEGKYMIDVVESFKLKRKKK